jgi:hypothetical protein
MVSEGLETHSNTAPAEHFSSKLLLTLSASRGQMQRRGVSETETKLSSVAARV